MPAHEVDNPLSTQHGSECHPQEQQADSCPPVRKGGKVPLQSVPPRIVRPCLRRTSKRYELISGGESLQFGIFPYHLRVIKLEEF